MAPSVKDWKTRSISLGCFIEWHQTLWNINTPLMTSNKVVLVYLNIPLFWHKSDLNYPIKEIYISQNGRLACLSWFIWHRMLRHSDVSHRDWLLLYECEFALAALTNTGATRHCVISNVSQNCVGIEELLIYMVLFSQSDSLQIKMKVPKTHISLLWFSISRNFQISNFVSSIYVFQNCDSFVILYASTHSNTVDWSLKNPRRKQNFTTIVGPHPI